MIASFGNNYFYWNFQLKSIEGDLHIKFQELQNKRESMP